METQIVPSGECVISKQKNVRLEAFLGTCVGLVLRDREANLGGLLHILLPEPTGTDIPFQPETYASTGVPRFIQTMIAAGASLDRLEASVAGGALVGPVSDQDLFLNIGGRTTEVVEAILGENGIPVNRVETGGYFSCKLTLYLNDLKIGIEPLSKPVVNLPETDHKKPTPSDIDTVIQQVRPIPQIALKIIRMIQDDDCTMAEIGKEIRQDQVISAKTLNLCNSAQFGLKSRVDSIDHALVLLGEKRLLMFVVSASLEIIFSESSQGYSLCKGGIFQHALGTAMLSGELAEFTGRSAPDIAYTAGLLHDIGKVPLDQYMTPATPYFYRAAHEEGRELCKVEKERFDITHTEAGALLGERWTLADNLIDAISHHHYPEEATVDKDLVTIVYLADLLMSRFRVDHEFERLNTDKIDKRLKQVGLSPDHFPVIVDRIPRSIFQSSQTTG